MAGDMQLRVAILLSLELNFKEWNLIYFILRDYKLNFLGWGGVWRLDRFLRKKISGPHICQEKAL